MVVSEKEPWLKKQKLDQFKRALARLDKLKAEGIISPDIKGTQEMARMIDNTKLLIVIEGMCADLRPEEIVVRKFLLEKTLEIEGRSYERGAELNEVEISFVYASILLFLQGHGLAERDSPTAQLVIDDYHWFLFQIFKFDLLVKIVAHHKLAEQSAVETQAAKTITDEMDTIEFNIELA